MISFSRLWTRGACAGALILTIFFLSGCQSVQFLLADLFGGESSGGGASASSLGTALPKATGGQQGTAITLQSLPVSQSYDKAYSFRTDMADKSIVAFIKRREVDSLRSSNPNGWLRTVAEEINRVARNDFEKAKLAHDVTAVLISYDAASFWSGNLPPQDFASVIKSQKAVCEGYAAVYKKLCDTLKLSCKTIHGYARGVGTTLATEGDVTESNHAWNMVQLAGNWYLVDCTWDSGYMEGKAAKQRYSTDWLFLRPEHFIYSHFPEQQRDQLLAALLSPQEFSKLPDLRPKFFQTAKNFMPLPAKTNHLDNSFAMEFSETDGYQLDFSLRNGTNGRTVNNASLVRRQQDGSARVDFSFPASGLYVVDVFWHKAGSSRGESCGQFLVQAQNAGTIQYPSLFPVKNVQVVEPLSMPLTAGTTVDFQVAAPQHKFVAVIYGRTYLQLENDGSGNFSAQVPVPRNIKELSIGAANSQRGSYEIVAKYSVK